MKNNFNTHLLLENPQREENILSVFTDIGNQDLVGLTITHEEKELTLCNNEISGNAEEFFHLDKFQVGCLIDYLKRIYDDMEDIK